MKRIENITDFFGRGINVILGKFKVVTRNRYEVLQRRNYSLRDQLDSVRNQRNKFRNQVESLREKLDKSKRVWERRADRISNQLNSVRNQRSKLRNQIELLKKELENEKRNFEAAIAAKESLQVELNAATSLTKKSKVLEINLAGLSSALSRNNEEVFQLRSELEKSKIKEKKLNEEIKALQIITQKAQIRNEQFRHQKSNFSYAGRNKKILEIIKNYIFRNSQLPKKILSFGCSNGYECISLSELFPQSEIFGCDVDDNILLKAMDTVSGRASIFYSSKDNLIRFGPFDLITVFNVLCNYPASDKVANISEVYPFVKFDEILQIIHSVLAVGGYLAIYNSAYFFEDSSVYEKFSPVDLGLPESGWIEKSAKNGCKVSQTLVKYNGEIFHRQKFKALVNNIRSEGKQLEEIQAENFVSFFEGKESSNSLSTVLWKKLLD